MRTHRQDKITVNYPDEHCYIFNPVTIEISGLTVGQKVEVEVAGITISASAFNGKAIFNISEILQSLFNVNDLSLLEVASISRSKTAIAATVNLPIAGLRFTTLAIWGALQTDLGITIGGDFNNDFNSDFFNAILRGSNINLVWHYDRPFTVGVPVMIGDKIFLGVDGVGRFDIYTANESIIANISPQELLNELKLNATSFITLYLQGGETTKREYRIDIDKQNCNPLYLRWIDKKGYYCYWAFEKATDSYESENYGAYIPTYTRSVHYVDGFNGGDGRQQGKTAKRNINLVAPLVSQSIWSYLLGIAQSPIVDLFTDNDYLGNPRFIKVDVQTGKINSPTGELSDFTVSITLPEINNQKI